MPGMITMRSLLPEAFTAGWISWKVQRFASLLLIFSSRLAAFLLSLRWSVGLMS